MRAISVSRKTLVLPSLLQKGRPKVSAGFLVSQALNQRGDLRSFVAASSMVWIMGDVIGSPHSPELTLLPPSGDKIQPHRSTYKRNADAEGRYL